MPEADAQEAERTTALAEEAALLEQEIALAKGKKKGGLGAILPIAAAALAVPLLLGKE